MKLAKRLYEALRASSAFGYTAAARIGGSFSGDCNTRDGSYKKAIWKVQMAILFT